MAGADAEDAWQIRQALDLIVRDSLRFGGLWLAALLAFFAVADFWINPPPYQWRLALVDAISALALFSTYAAFRWWNLAPKHANAVGAGVAGLTAVGILHDMWTLADPQQTTYLMLVVVGAASILLSSRWMLAIVALSILGWGLVASTAPGERWLTFGMALFATCVLGVVIHTVRMAAYARLERIRRQENQRTQELEIREEALQGLVGALQESEDRYRSLVEQAPDAFLVLADRQVLYVNPAGVRLFGASSPEDLVGRDPISLVHPDDRERIGARNAQIERDGRPTEFTETRIVRLDGRVVEVETLGQPIVYMGRRADQTIVRDVTDRKRIEAERLRTAKQAAEIERLKEMDRVKTQFVNTISHELRTPLTPVRVQLHILKRGTPSPESYQKALDVLDRNFQRLNGLVDELLEVARIQAGTLRISKTFVELSPVVQHALESYVDVAKHNDIHLGWKLDPELHVAGDAKRLTQVMYNLLGNAFKFTPKGGEVHVEARREGADAVVRVRDTGPGLTDEDIARLFEPFSQVHDTMEKTNAGTGLGLYICRGIVEGHDGRIWCESGGPGKGATFAFRIPLAAPGKEEPAPQASAQASPQ